MQHTLPLDFVLSFCRDMIPEKGEDSYCYSFCDTAGMLGVFDGCGGAGARTHAFYSGKTEAYIAARLCAGAFYDSFCATFPSQVASEQLVEETFAAGAIRRLVDYAPPKEENGLRIAGSMVRTLPTTAAVALIRQEENGDLLLSAIWAGDSRVYLWDDKGLHQLTVDDTSVPDPMDTLYEDGVLRNLFCSDRKVKTHCKTIQVKLPFMILAATDGCFGYVSTPMEFEGMLSDTLLKAEAPAQWEELLAERISTVAGDDHTLCLGAFGYESFQALQESQKARYSHMVDTYLTPVGGLPLEDRESRYALWAQYKVEYMKYLEGELA